MVNTAVSEAGFFLLSLCVRLLVGYHVWGPSVLNEVGPKSWQCFPTCQMRVSAEMTPRLFQLGQTLL